METFVLRAEYARRLPDPTFKNDGVDRHVLFVQVGSFPAALAERLNPNARQPNTDRQVYKDVRKSLESNDGLFHLKNKGITVVARRVEKRDDDEYVLMLSDTDGILDGGHTARIITEVNASGENGIPKQYVKVEVLTALDDSLIDEISGGLNTSVQVKLMSLQNLGGAFDWLKEILRSKPYFSRIAWSENDEGEIDAREIIAILSMFVVDQYPAKPDVPQPIRAYSSKEAVLKAFVDDPAPFKRLAPIIPDILELHDHIAASSQGIWNEGDERARGRFGGLKWVKQTSRVLPFTGTASAAQPMPSALLPLTACFRQFVVLGSDGNYRWSERGRDVKQVWSDHGLALLRVTDQACDEAGRNPNKMGKSTRHWAGLLAHSIINFQ